MDFQVYKVYKGYKVYKVYKVYKLYSIATSILDGIFLGQSWSLFLEVV